MDTVQDNPSRSRFELHVRGEVAAAYYTRLSDLIVFTHTEVPEALSGKGIGSKLIQGSLELVRAKGLKAAAECPFVAAFLAKHPEFNDLLSDPATHTKN